MIQKSEWWKLNKKKMKVSEMKVLRWMYGVNGVCMVWIMNKYVNLGVKNIAGKRRKIDWNYLDVVLRDEIMLKQPRI